MTAHGHAACLIAAVASLLRGGIYVHGVHPAPVARGAAIHISSR